MENTKFEDDNLKLLQEIKTQLTKTLNEMRLYLINTDLNYTSNAEIIDVLGSYYEQGVMKKFIIAIENDNETIGKIKKYLEIKMIRQLNQTLSK